MSKTNPTSNAKLIQLMELLYSQTATALAQTPDDNFELLIGLRQDRPELPPGSSPESSPDQSYHYLWTFFRPVFLDKCVNFVIKFLQLKAEFQLHQRIPKGQL